LGFDKVRALRKTGVPATPQIRANMYVCYEQARPFYRDKIHHPVASAIVTAIKNLPNE
jgi:hypothetical protein